MFINPINNLIEQKKAPAELSYLGTVEDNNDPEKLGRIKVLISLFDNCKTDQLPWACPISGPQGNISSAGGLNVPEIGSQVRVFFPSGDVTAPYYTGAELNELNKTTFFDDDYPNVYGYKDSTGNFIRVNKAKGTIQVQHKSSSNLRVAPDGSMQVSLSNGAYFTFSNQNNFELDISGVNIIGTGDGTLGVTTDMNVNVKTLTMSVDANSVAFSGDVTVGTGATGSFWAMGSLVTVKNGIVVGIE